MGPCPWARACSFACSCPSALGGEPPLSRRWSAAGPVPQQGAQHSSLASRTSVEPRAVGGGLGSAPLLFVLSLPPWLQPAPLSRTWGEHLVFCGVGSMREAPRNMPKVSPIWHSGRGETEAQRGRHPQHARTHDRSNPFLSHCPNSVGPILCGILVHHMELKRVGANQILWGLDPPAW